MAEEKTRSVFGKLGVTIADSYKILIRPNKPKYQILDLGPPTQVLNNTKYVRKDFTYCNRQNN